MQKMTIFPLCNMPLRRGVGMVVKKTNLPFLMYKWSLINQTMYLILILNLQDRSFIKMSWKSKLRDKKGLGILDNTLKTCTTIFQKV